MSSFKLFVLYKVCSNYCGATMNEELKAPHADLLCPIKATYTSPNKQSPMAAMKQKIPRTESLSLSN